VPRALCEPLTVYVPVSLMVWRGGRAGTAARAAAAAAVGGAPGRERTCFSLPPSLSLSTRPVSDLHARHFCAWHLAASVAALAKFQWSDPLSLDSQLTEDEIAMRYTPTTPLPPRTCVLIEGGCLCGWAIATMCARTASGV
jgi:hypothetical protein